jgi:hypothetical protein
MRKNDMCSSNTCDMYMCRLRHINDAVLSSLKIEGIRLIFYSVQLAIISGEKQGIVKMTNPLTLERLSCGMQQVFTIKLYSY